MSDFILSLIPIAIGAGLGLLFFISRNIEKMRDDIADLRSMKIKEMDRDRD